MKEIATAIQEGEGLPEAQFSTLWVFLGILTVALFFVLPVSDLVTTLVARLSPELDPFRPVVGVPARRRCLDAHGVCGHVAAVRANVRTANAAKESGSGRR